MVPTSQGFRKGGYVKLSWFPFPGPHHFLIVSGYAPSLFHERWKREAVSRRAGTRLAAWEGEERELCGVWQEYRRNGDVDQDIMESLGVLYSNTCGFRSNALL